MAGTLKKTMIYLGLADEDEQDAPAQQTPAQQGAQPRPGAVSAGERSEAPSREHGVVPREQTKPAARPEPKSGRGQQHAQEPARPEHAPSYRAQGSSAAGSGSHSGAQETEGSRSSRPGATVTPLSQHHAHDTYAPAESEEDTVQQIMTIHPKSYNDAKVIGEAFRNNIPVIMNVTQLQENEAKRLVDFSAGLVFGLNGKISRVTSKVFLLAPEDVEVPSKGEASTDRDDDQILVEN